MITQAETTVFDLCCNLVLGYITRHFRFMQSAKNYLSDVPVIYILISSRLKIEVCVRMCVATVSCSPDTFLWSCFDFFNWALSTLRLSLTGSLAFHNHYLTHYLDCV